jgi:hypothetical protein
VIIQIYEGKIASPWVIGDGSRDSEATAALQIGGDSAQQFEDLRARAKNCKKALPDPFRFIALFLRTYYF